MYLVIPMMDHLTPHLPEHSNGRVLDGVSPSFALWDQSSKSIEEVTSLIKINNLGIYACLIHPVLRSLAFVHDFMDRSSMKIKGTLLLREMVKNIMPKALDTANLVMPSSQSVVLNDLGESSFELSKAIYFLGDDDSRVFHELYRFLEAILSRHMRANLNHLHGVTDFWEKSESCYPHLSIVALRILSTSASSASSERDFSDVSNILTPNRSALDPSLVNDILFLRSS